MSELPEPIIAAEPDLRFALASERTLLAYQRTAIALIVAAVGFAHFLDGGPLLLILCLVLVVGGAVAAIGGHYRYLAVNHAIASGKPIPSSPVPLLLTTSLFGVVILSVIMVIEKAR
ncbi:MAG: putative rane protein [Marmoricola sp.]|nr:putative rane protein [Marmoricola sp.]